VFDPLLAEPAHHLQASHPVVAKDDDRSFLGFERVQRFGYSAHRNQLTALNASLPVFEWLAHVNQTQLFAGVETLLDFLRSDLNSKGHVRL
jgi:hypothetical protein